MDRHDRCVAFYHLTPDQKTIKCIFPTCWTFPSSGFLNSITLPHTDIKTCLKLRKSSVFYHWSISCNCYSHGPFMKQESIRKMMFLLSLLQRPSGSLKNKRNPLVNGVVTCSVIFLDVANTRTAVWHANSNAAMLHLSHSDAVQGTEHWSLHTH